MKPKKQFNYSLFDEPSFEDVTGGMALNKQELLQALSQMKASESLLSLRNQVNDLKVRLRSKKNSDEMFSDNGECVDFDEEILFGDIKQLEEALTLERAKYYIKRLAKGVADTRTSKINDINLNRWKEYDDIKTDSLWVLDKRDSSGVHTAGYWGNYIPQIPNQMMRRYTKKGEWVLDTFAGCGTTFIESQRLGRNAIGVELQEPIAEKAINLIASEPNKHGVVSEILTADSTSVDYGPVLQKHGQKSVQLVLMHPPYFDIIKFSDDSRDLSNAASLESFLVMLSKVAANALSVLDKGRYLILVISDKYSKGDWIPLGFAAMNEIIKLGCSLKSIIVKNFDDTTAKRNQKELWRYRALAGGFYIFKHEYIFLFKKQ